MGKYVTFQQAISLLQEFWADYGCLIWQPYNVQVGAGTMNPATTLRVLGPEPWRVAYVEPSVRPDDSRYGQNPNRMQQHYQYQVILKPDPGNPQEIYLKSLEALGINQREHDIRFVEDNWESPALGAWGLGWEVWLDGQEITQFTYFQQAGGVTLDPVSVEITYGLERIVMALQKVHSFTDIGWTDSIKYGDILLQSEIEHSKYNLDYADVELLAGFYANYEREAEQCLKNGLLIPAYDYILKCSHTFNILDARGAIGVTERASYFARMRNLTHRVATQYLKQREDQGYPLLSKSEQRQPEQATAAPPAELAPALGAGSADFVLEVGCEELPVSDLSAAVEQLQTNVPRLLADLRLAYDDLQVLGAPRRLAVLVKNLATQQADKETELKGPPAAVAFDQAGQPTKAALGFSRNNNVPLEALRVKDFDGRPYVVATITEKGRPASEVLAEQLPALLASLRFAKSMRWNASQVMFSRPIRWLVALLGDRVIPFSFAGVNSGRVTRGLRPLGSPEIPVPAASDYPALMEANSIIINQARRRAMIQEQVGRLAAEVGGETPADESLLEEVTNLVEKPTALRGGFDPDFLKLPQEVLITVMKKHQRYFPVVEPNSGRLLPYFIAVRNGDEAHLDLVRDGNEEVLRARYTDAAFFYEDDTKKPLESFLPRLNTLTFQEKLGSVLDKVKRLEQLVPRLGRLLNVSAEDLAVSQRATHLCKADLGTQMVIELTSLQGIMGRQYALHSGESPAVAQAIFEHYLPRFAGDDVPRTAPGMLIALADRLDSLLGLFAVGLAPTSAADPYGLRRAAIGLVQILVENRVSLSLLEALEQARDLLPVETQPSLLKEVQEFIVGRLRVWLREKGYHHDVVESVLAARGDNPYRAHESVMALERWAARDDWLFILNTYGRCVRIVREYRERYPINPDAFTEASEQRLYASYVTCRAQVRPDSSIDDFFKAFLPMLEPINTFFDDVLVMAPDLTVRQNRLALLQAIAALTEGIVDLTQMEGF